MKTELVLLMATVSWPAMGGGHGALTITVADPSGAAVAGAVVRVTFKDTWAKLVLRTDDQGRARVHRAPALEFRLRVEGRGYRLYSDARDCLVVVGGRAIVVPVELQLASDHRRAPPLPCPRLKPDSDTALVLSPQLDCLLRLR